MDIYLGRQLTFGVVQTHDYNPGIASNGVFWTTALPSQTGGVDPAAGTGSMAMADMPIGDYSNIPMGGVNGPHVPAKVSYNITWSPGANPKRLHAHDTTNGFGGDFTQGTATGSWSASEEGFTFTSTPGETPTTDISYVGTEQNGRYFKP